MTFEVFINFYTFVMVTAVLFNALLNSFIKLSLIARLDVKDDFMIYNYIGMFFIMQDLRSQLQDLIPEQQVVSHLL